MYGYADGDPINNSDPFGLCPIEKPLCSWLKATLVLAGTDIGMIAGGGAGLLGLAGGPAAAATVPAGAAVGGAVGATLGAIAGELLENVFFSRNARENDSEPRQQYDEISKRQQQLRSRGEGDKINSIKKSKQNDRRRLREEAEEALEENKRKP